VSVTQHAPHGNRFQAIVCQHRGQLGLADRTRRGQVVERPDALELLGLGLAQLQAHGQHFVHQDARTAAAAEALPAVGRKFHHFGDAGAKDLPRLLDDLAGTHIVARIVQGHPQRQLMQTQPAEFGGGQVQDVDQTKGDRGTGAGQIQTRRTPAVAAFARNRSQPGGHFPVN